MADIPMEAIAEILLEMPELMGREERERRGLEYIPVDLIADIFSRLPAKSLLQFRCLSKTLCALIDSREFIKQHLNRSIKTKNNLSVILHRNDNLYSVALDSLDVAAEADHPFKNSNCQIEFLTCCDGLFCFNIGEENAAVWNPTTRKFLNLPFAPIKFPKNYTDEPDIIYAIGYDSVSDDYKVVRIVQFDWECYDSEVRVYCLKLNSWRRIGNFPQYLAIEQGDGVFSCGALHWKAYERGDLIVEELIVAFDLATEERRLLPQPDCYHSYADTILGELDGSFCIFCNDFASHVDVWVMKVYGVKESWTKLFSVAHSDPMTFEIMVPLSYSKSGSEVLMVEDYARFLWYDIKQGTMYHVVTDGLPNFFGSHKVCVESLVPVGGGRETDGMMKYKQGKRKKMKKKMKKKENNQKKRFVWKTLF